MSRERLQKILARAGVASRRQVEDMIRQGRVTLNGQQAQLGDRADLAEDAVKVDGKRVQPSHKPHVYLLLNKPRAVVSTVSDPEERSTVMELVPERLQKGLVPVGRLDYDSEGLLLLTDDGELAHRVAHPRFGCVKTYEVKVKGFPKPGDIDRLRRGIPLDGRMTAPARIESFTGPIGLRDASTSSWWRVAIGEGRPRQIREMFQRVGHPVQRLRRVAIGSVSDPRLLKGTWRELTPEEIESLKTGSGKPPVLSRGRRPLAKSKRSADSGGAKKGRAKGKRPGEKEPRHQDGGSKKSAGGRKSTAPASGSKSRGVSGKTRSAGAKLRPAKSQPGGPKSTRKPRRGPKTSGRGNPR